MATISVIQNIADDVKNEKKEQDAMKEQEEKEQTEPLHT